MSYKTKLKKTALLLVLALTLVGLIFSLEVTDVTLSPVNATTMANLSCTWTVSGETQVNISWYNNSVLFNTSEDVTSPVVLPYTFTTKDETWNCTINAANTSLILSGSDKITIKNTPPVTPILQNTSNIDIGGYEEIREGETHIFTLISSDVDVIDSLIYSETKLIGNDYCDIDSDTGVFTCTPTSEPTVSINDQYQLIVFDGDNLVGLVVEFNVTPVNDLPSFNTTIENQVINETETLQYSITVTDEENSTGPFTFNVSSNYSTERIQNVTSDNITFTIQFEDNRATDFNDTGNYTIFIQACDPDNSSLCINDSFVLEVVTVNHLPNIAPIENSSGTQNENLLVYVNATDIDVLDELSFSVDSLDCGIDIWNIVNLETNATNASGLINVTLNNTHVYCENITITVSDGKQSSSANVYLDLTNVNDAPVLHNISYYGGNTHQNTLITNLTAYAGVLFVYQVNGTDVDLLVDDNEALTFTDNSSNCLGNCPYLTMDSSSGIVTFMPNNSVTGNFSYLINLSDNYGNSTTAIMNIAVYENLAPYFNQSIENQTAYEDTVFTLQINATDPEGAFDTFYTNSTLFNISQTGLIDFTPICSDIGNYTFRVVINDTFSSENETNFSLEIIMVADAPTLSAIPNKNSLEGIPFLFNITPYSDDDDITCNQTDALNFTSEFVYGTEFFNITNEGIISFTPDNDEQGSYLINITVNDSFGLSQTVTWNLTVFNRTYAPLINNITPYDTPMNTSWISISILGVNFTNTNATENTTITFDHNSTDIDGNEIVYNWTIEGVHITTNKSYTKYFGFEDNNTYSIVLTVSDNVSGIIAHEVNFTWNLTIENLNRPPLLNSSFENITNITELTTLQNFFYGGVGNIKFNDPDNDILTYTFTNTTYFTLSYENNDLTITPISIGAEYVTFTASDGIAELESNMILINVTDIANATTETTSSSGSSSSSRVVPYTVIQEVEVEKEVFLDIINPEPAVVYSNNSLRQVINIINNGNNTLTGIFLSASTNSTSAEISFSNNYISELLPGDIKKTDLIIQDYRIYNNYEVIISANVTNPGYKDRAIIYINALEKSKGNQSVSQTKITFAQDLLNSNPECIELNEFLKKALNSMEQQNYEEASRITDAVIQGCKYLVSQQKIYDESPQAWLADSGLSKIPFIKPILITFVIAMIFTLFITIRAKKLNEKNEDSE